MSNPTHEIAAPERPQALLAPPPGSTPKTEPEKPQTAPEKPARRSRRWLYIILFLVLALAALFFWSRTRSTPASTQKAGGKGGRGASAVTPVVAVQAET